jgi:hypothetical protein
VLLDAPESECEGQFELIRLGTHEKDQAHRIHSSHHQRRGTGIRTRNLLGLRG